MRAPAGTVVLTIALCFATEIGIPSPGLADTLPFDIRQSLETSTRVLYDLVRPGYNPIPLPVLNQARCAVLINGKGAQEAEGIVSCRLSPNDWSGPAFLSFRNSDRVQASNTRELLVLIMNDKTAKSLQRGQLRLGSRDGSQPGPLLDGHTRLNESDIKANTFTYNLAPSRSLAATALTGSMTLDKKATNALYSGAPRISKVLTGREPVPAVATNYATAVSSFFNMITPIGIIVHHSATLPPYHRVPTSELQVDRFHEKRGFAVVCSGRLYHVAYHYFILPNGKVKIGRPENCQGAHAHGYNAYLGISLAGDFSSSDNPGGRRGLTRPTAAQMRSLTELCSMIMKRYKIPAKNVLRHSDVSNTRCPGDRFPYAALMKSLERSVATVPNQTSPTTAKESTVSLP
jgi:lipid-binding SYLF domain-containing protein